VSSGWESGQHEALWADPQPTTPEGQRLWQLFKDGKLGTSVAGIRDFGQRICQIEAEARGGSGEGERPGPRGVPVEGAVPTAVQNAWNEAHDG
jgi:hypothetical protein